MSCYFPTTSANGRQVMLLGERHWVHKRFHDQIAAADREAGFTT
ncbi:hypothetical protein ACFV4K_04085 [Nocardia sp. NPDC059764]